MSTLIHLPEGLRSFHIRHTECASSCAPETILLKRVVTDLNCWLDCAWAAAMIPTNSATLVPELCVVSVEGSGWEQQSPELVVPVRDQQTTGLAAIVVIGPKRDGTGYREQDRLLADALCCHVSTLLADDQLLRKVSETLLSVEQIPRDLDGSQGIYDRLDRCEAAHIPGLEYRGQCLRAGATGGDYFDVEPRMNGGLFVAVGTVGARGMAGGIVLGGALASLRALVRPGDSLLRIAREMNRTLWELSPENSFTSLLCAEIDPARNCLHYVNAGHEPALLLRKATERIDRLEPTGAILGLSRRGAFRELTIPFEPGDMLAAFTDGVAESLGPREVARKLREEQDCAVPDLVSNLLDAASANADRTVVLARSSRPTDLPLRMTAAQELVAA